MPSATWYRIVKRERATREDVLQSRGGRFQGEPEEGPMTYVADSLRTAWREVTAHLGVPANPRAFRAWRVTLTGARLVDLRETDAQVRFQITAQDLAAVPAPPTCAATAGRVRRAREDYHGLIYPSVRNLPDGVCAVLFLERTEALIELEPVGEDEWERFIREGDG
ncbi:MAG TPA: RES family NAD+ phosphorylase [Candidatus Methylomirabilis sp.]|nr:RES family NAD+ phosphorylase [Candidatus Methylomirabilis sp.]